MSDNRKYTVFPLVIFSCMVFFPASLGFPYGEIIAYALCLIMVFFSGSISFIKYDQYVWINKATLLLFFFLLFSVISVFLSVNPEKSAYFWFQYLVLSLIFIFSYKNKLLIKNIIRPLLLAAGVILCIYSLFINYFQLSFLVPSDGYQLVYSRFGSHNHLGDFLMLPMLICVFDFMYKRSYIYLALLLFYTPFFIFSYSRSAYLSFFLVGTIFMIYSIKRAKEKKQFTVPGILFLTLFGVILLFFLSSVYEARYNTFLRPVHQILINNYILKFKSFDANRIEYWKETIQSIREKPFFGIGPGNFIYTSSKYSGIPNYRTHSSHNIFLDIFAENGLLAFICFSLLIMLLIRVILADKSLYSLLFLALLLNFQTDYTFKISPLIIVFFMLLGIIYKESRREG